MISLIAAVGKNLELGKDNGLLWNLPGDRKFFRTTTAGHTVVMGRLTFESIGRPLPKRRNIVISRNTDYKPDGVEVYASLEEAFNACGNDCFIIGGAMIYSLSLPYADELILTEVDAECPDADVYFPRFDKEQYAAEVIGENCDEGINYKHIRYVKK
ncbi:MAG: dihydrofolate reductase [Oscillospiraceae bacterium]|nr:dihydrofolate reductase [Oscillospiraceae bacterium]